MVYEIPIVTLQHRIRKNGHEFVYPCCRGGDRVRLWADGGRGVDGAVRRAPLRSVATREVHARAGHHCATPLSLLPTRQGKPVSPATHTHNNNTNIAQCGVG